jgi:hypothetical protein
MTPQTDETIHRRQDFYWPTIMLIADLSIDKNA